MRVGEPGTHLAGGDQLARELDQVGVGVGIADLDGIVAQILGDLAGTPPVFD